MKKVRQNIGLDCLQLNTGQIDWLPANPRTWTQSDVDATRDSILEDEDFLEDRPLLVVPFGKEFVIFAGNIRREGAAAARKVTVPCVIYHPETEADYDTVLRRAMKDNGTYGKTDWHAIYSSKWGTLPLEKWGLKPVGEDWPQAAGAGTATGAGEGKEGNSEGSGIPGNLDAEPKNAPFVCKITFPNADSMTRFVNGYKNILEDEFGCSMSESGGEL